MKHNKPLYIVDFDDVLVNMSWKWAMKAYSSICTPKEICDTVINSTKKWLYDKFNQPEGNILDYYLSDKNFYSDLPPTRFCEKLNKISDKNDVFVISYIMESWNADDKANWLKKYLPNAKYQFVYYKTGIKKSEIINNFELGDYIAFADDRISNIVDVMENTNSENKMFYIPRFGCNSIDMIMEKLKNNNWMRERNIIPFYMSDLYVENYSILDKVDWHKWV